MLHAVEPKPASERTPEACDFADRMRLMLNDVRMVELATEALRPHYCGAEEDVNAIVMTCRRLYGELAEMADEVLPPMTEA
jgi:hypothetical protein